MPVYSYVVDDTYGEVWVLSEIGTRSGDALYKRSDAVAGFDADDVIGAPVKGWRESAIDNLYGIRSSGPEVLPAHTAESARLDEFERTHTFVNTP
jgi:hypothetical protein